MSAHRVDTVDLRRHPLALTPTKRAKLEESGAIQQRGEVVEFTPAPSGRLREVAEIYLAKTWQPQGKVKELAQQHGLNYHSLLTSIGKLRDERAARSPGKSFCAALRQ